MKWSAMPFQDKETMLRLARTIDKANGYVFGDLEERDLRAMMSCAVSAEFEYEKIANIQEKYVEAEREGDGTGSDSKECIVGDGT